MQQEYPMLWVLEQIVKDLESITISPLQAGVLKTSVETGMEWYGILWNSMDQLELH